MTSNCGSQAAQGVVLRRSFSSFDAGSTHRDREREILGPDVGDSEDEVFWRSFLFSLKQRGLSGVKLVISDQHSGLVKALKRAFQGVAHQRCRVHSPATCWFTSPKGQADHVAAAVRGIFTQPTAADVDAAWDKTRDELAARLPKLGPRMDEAKAEMLVFTAFPREHWSKIWSPNPLERVSQEIKRRSRVVGKHSVLQPQHPSWSWGHRRRGSIQASSIRLWIVLLELDSRCDPPHIRSGGRQRRRTSMTAHKTPGDRVDNVFDFNHLESMVPASTTRQTFAEMRERCPVAHSPHFDGFDIITRYGDVQTALNEPATFSSADGVFIPSTGAAPTPALDFDEPEHSRWRAILNGPLTRTAVRAFEPTITQIVDDQIDTFAADGSADLVSAFSDPVPAIVIGQLVGLNRTESIELKPLASAAIASIGAEDFDERFAAFSDFVESKLSERRAVPREDFITKAAHGEIDGEKLVGDDAVSILRAYLAGGHHSTSAGIAWLINFVLTEPGVRDRLQQDRRLIPPAIEESLRLATPLPLFARTVKCPVEVGGEALPEGRRVLLALAAANRDPREFSDAENFDLDRARNRHLAFGSGPHLCPGQHLARAEMRIALNRLLDRLPDLHLNGTATEAGLTGGVLMPIASLPTSFTPESKV